jgi:hypothetical protein
MKLFLDQKSQQKMRKLTGHLTNNKSAIRQDVTMFRDVEGPKGTLKGGGETCGFIL